MSTHDRYAYPEPREHWFVPASTPTAFTWEYDEGRDRLLALYQKGKDKQWDATKRIDWSIDVDPMNPTGFPEAYNPFLGTEIWERLTEDQRENFSRHFGSWTFSQFLHGEQGAMMVSARIVETVPDLDSKFYAATQTMDEARHVEVYSKFLQEKAELVYPVNRDLAQLLEEALTRKEWDYPYLGMQVLIEGLALAAFGLYRDMTENDLVRQILAYVMQDEARHVAFGRLALKDYYAELTEKERAEREDFVVEGCWLMRERLLAREVYETLEMPVAECLDIAIHSPVQQAFRTLIFSRIVPCVKDIGLWGEKVQKCYAEMGVLDMASSNLDELMASDEQIADRIDEEKMQARAAEVEQTIAAAS